MESALCWLHMTILSTETETETETEIEIEALKRVAAALAQVDCDMQLIHWTRASCANVDIGKHLTALEAHIDNAIGRCSTLISAVRANQ